MGGYWVCHQEQRDPRPGDERMDVAQLPDARLVHAAKAGDTAALDELCRRYWPRVRRYCLASMAPDDAEEAVQTTFERVIKRLPAFEGGQDIGAYIMKTARFACLDQRRSRSAPHEVASCDVRIHGEEDRASTDAFDNVLDQITVRGLLEALRHREALLLLEHHMQLRPLQDLADQLDSTPGSIAVRLHRARRAARRLAEESGVRALWPAAGLGAAWRDVHRWLKDLALPGMAHAGLALTAAGLVVLSAGPDQSGLPRTTYSDARTIAVGPHAVVDASPSASTSTDAGQRVPAGRRDRLPAAAPGGPAAALHTDTTLPLPPVGVPGSDRQIRQEYPEDPDVEIRAAAGPQELVSVAVEDEPTLDPATDRGCPQTEGTIVRVDCADA